MGLFNFSSEVDSESVEQELSELLIEREQVKQAFKVMKDLVIFTNRRMILMDKKGLTGKNRTYLNIPYHSIEFFEIETRGFTPMDADLKLFLRSHPEPVVLEFRKDDQVMEIMRELGKWVL